MSKIQKIGLIGLTLLLVTTTSVFGAAENSIVMSGNTTTRTHVESIGWQDWKDEGVQSGTSGQGLRLEGIEIETINMHDAEVGIKYQTHVQNLGWQDWKTDGVTSGTVGNGLRLEAIRIELTGADADQFDVYYQVHAQNFGWQGWAKNGESAGTAGYGFRLEAINILLKEKSENSPVIDGQSAFYENEPVTNSGATNESNWDGSNLNATPIDRTGAKPGNDPVFGNN